MNKTDQFGVVLFAELRKEALYVRSHVGVAEVALAELRHQAAQFGELLNGWEYHQKNEGAQSRQNDDERHDDGQYSPT